jgi:hypothetical protein
MTTAEQGKFGQEPGERSTDFDPSRAEAVRVGDAVYFVHTLTSPSDRPLRSIKKGTVILAAKELYTLRAWKNPLALRSPRAGDVVTRTRSQVLTAGELVALTGIENPEDVDLLVAHTATNRHLTDKLGNTMIQRSRAARASR